MPRNRSKNKETILASAREEAKYVIEELHSRINSNPQEGVVRYFTYKDRFGWDDFVYENGLVEYVKEQMDKDGYEVTANYNSRRRTIRSYYSNEPKPYCHEDTSMTFDFEVKWSPK